MAFSFFLRLSRFSIFCLALLCVAEAKYPPLKILQQGTVILGVSPNTGQTFWKKEFSQADKIYLSSSSAVVAIAIYNKNTHKSRLLSVERNSGNVHWQKEILDAIKQPHVLGNKVIAPYFLTGPRDGNFVGVFHAKTGKRLLKFSGDFLIQSKGKLLFFKQSHFYNYEDGYLLYKRYNPKTNILTDLLFGIPNRPKCGSPIITVSEEHHHPAHIGLQHIYIPRHDQCGDFIARYNWHGSNKQSPVVFSTR